MNQEQAFVTGALRTPRAAAVSGILFSVLLATALVLLNISIPTDVTRPGEWLTDHTKRTSVALALNLIPFAGIAFLWFIGVVRDRIGHQEDRLFGTVFLGSGLLFTATLFVAAAVAGGVIADATLRAGVGLNASALAEGRHITSYLLRLYVMRMAGVFTLSASTILLRTRVAPRWMALLGVVVAVILLVTLGLSTWIYLLFPAWIGLLSVYLLWRSLTGSPDVNSAPLSGPRPPVSHNS
jgi:hypothetical protein